MRATFASSHSLHASRSLRGQVLKQLRGTPDPARAAGCTVFCRHPCCQIACTAVAAEQYRRKCMAAPDRSAHARLHAQASTARVWCPQSPAAALHDHIELCDVARLPAWPSKRHRPRRRQPWSTWHASCDTRRPTEGGRLIRQLLFQTDCMNTFCASSLARRSASSCTLASGLAAAANSRRSILACEL